MKGKVLGKAAELTLTQTQYEKLKQCTVGQGGNQSLCERVHAGVRTNGGKHVAYVYMADMERIKKAIERSDRGTWQDLFREIMTSNQSIKDA